MRPEETPPLYIEFPRATYATWQYDAVHDDKGRTVGASTYTGFSWNERAMLSLAVVEPEYAEPGRTLGALGRTGGRRQEFLVGAPPPGGDRRHGRACSDREEIAPGMVFECASREHFASPRWGGAQASSRPPQGAGRQPHDTRCVVRHHTARPQRVHLLGRGCQAGDDTRTPHAPDPARTSDGGQRRPCCSPGCQHRERRAFRPLRCSSVEDARRDGPSTFGAPQEPQQHGKGSDQETGETNGKAITGIRRNSHSANTATTRMPKMRRVFASSRYSDRAGPVAGRSRTGREGPSPSTVVLATVTIVSSSRCACDARAPHERTARPVSWAGGSAAGVGAATPAASAEARQAQLPRRLGLEMPLRRHTETTRVVVLSGLRPHLCAISGRACAVCVRPMERVKVRPTGGGHESSVFQRSSWRQAWHRSRP